jgi:hypothetical protein
MQVVGLWKPANLCKSGHTLGSTVCTGTLWRVMATGRDLIAGEVGDNYMRPTSGPGKAIVTKRIQNFSATLIHHGDDD